MIPNDTTWTDQPPELCGVPIVGTLSLRDGTLEVRRLENSGDHYVTIGNLFGSQTVFAGPAEKVLEVLFLAGGRPSSRPMTLPEGVFIIENARKGKAS